MPYDIYVLNESDLTISGGGQLDGVTQGDGSHLPGLTLTINNSNWFAVSINDDDVDFQDNDGSQTLNGDQTIDGVTYTSGTQLEAEYAFTVTDGTNTWTLVGVNVNNSSPSYGTVEGIAVADGPGLPPVGVPLTINGSLEGPVFVAEEYEEPVCFASGTQIDTPDGLIRVEDLKVGQLVTTKDNGPKPILWQNERVFPAVGSMAPVCFEIGAIGNSRPLLLSQQHRIWVDGWRAQLFFGVDAVLVPAVSFIGQNGVTLRTGGTVTYHHFMFDQHELVFAEGSLCESFHPGHVGLRGMGSATREELFAIFPELKNDVTTYGPAALPEVRGREAVALLHA